MRSTNSRFGLVSFLGALTLGVVSCGGSSGSPAAGSSPQPVLVHFGVPPTVVVGQPYWADKWGYFAQEGITADYVTVQSGVTLVQATLSGQIDFLSSAIEVPMQTAEAGQQMRTVVGEDNKQALALLVPTNSSASTIQDLKGKRIGVAALGSAQMTTYQVLLIQAGLPKDSVTFVPVGVGTAAAAAFKANTIDALLTSDPGIQILTLGSNPIAKIILDTRKGEGGLAAAPCCALAASLAYINAHADVVHRVVRAMAKALKRMHDHPDQALAVAKTLSIFNGIDPAVLADAVNSTVVNFTPVVTEADLTAVNNKLLLSGTLKLSHPFDQVVATQFTPDWNTNY